MKSKDLKPGRVYLDKFNTPVRIIGPFVNQSWANKGWWRCDLMFKNGEVNRAGVIRHSRTFISEISNFPTPTGDQ